MGYLSLYFVALVASSAVAGPVEFRNGPCARHCTENSKFKYEPGKTYIYDYEADTTTTLQGTTKDESRLHLRARVEINVISKCDFVMRLKSINLEQSEPGNPKSRSRAAGLEELQSALERYPLRFSFQDGVVDVVCPSHQEETSVMNIKRGILSTLQNSMANWEGVEDVIENDVAGKCPTMYQSAGKGWNSVTIRRTKDFATCTNRFNTDSAIQADFHGGMGTSTSPLVKGDQQCEQTFSNGLLQKTICTEQHNLRPFSRQSNGAVTRVAQTLTYKTVQPTTATGFEYQSTKRDMLFDHKNDIIENSRRERDAEMAFADLCSTARHDIKASVPAKFTSVIYTFRTIDYRTMSSIFKRVDQLCPNNNKAKKFFLDALPMVGNMAAVRMMKEMIENNDVNKGDAETWFTTIAFLSKPSKEMIRELTPILDGRYDQALLGVSAMINTFCKHNERCSEIEEVRQAVHKIANIIGNNCDGHKKKVLLALKAIGNIGVARGVEEKLQRCIAKKDIELRMAAIEAYRRFHCDISRDHLIRIFTDKEENVEVRLKSYLAAMKCPSTFLLETIETMLREEKLNQIGSFVWSHLNNFRNEELAQHVRRITSDLYLMNKFISDIRKYSRHVNSGIFLKSIDAGFNMGGNLIFTPESYIPRSAMVNLTVDIFGHRVNLFEVEGRAEGFEQIIESMFGPKAGRRAMNSDSRVAEMDTKFNAKDIYYKEPSATVDMKIFGNTLWHKKMNSGSMIREELSFMDVLIELSKEQDIEISKSLMFLDTTYTIPTGCGLPLHIAINGTATVDMKVSGKFDVRSLDSVNIRGHIQPSGAVEISSVMSVDAIIAKAGIKMVATLHSSNVMDGLLEVQKGTLVRAQINVPREQMEIITVQSKILLLNGDKEHEQMGVTDRRERLVKCSGGYTDRLLGVEMCGEMSLPSVHRNNVPLYPFSGPATLRVYLRKTDPTLTSYNFETKWIPEKMHFTMMFNTPESRIDREMSMDLHLNERERAVSMKVKTPLKRLSFNGKYLNDENEKKMDVSISVDDVEKFAVQAGLTRDETESGIRFMPVLKIQGSQGRMLNVRGVGTIRYGQKWSTELNIEDLTEKPITLKGDISLGEKDRYEGQMSVNSYLLDASVQGYAQLKNAVSTKLTIEYKFLEGRQEKMDLTAKFRDLSASSLNKYSGSGSFHSTAFPDYTTSLWWETQLTSGHYENMMEVTMGDGKVTPIHKVTFQEILHYSGDLYNNEVDGTLKMTYPQKNMDMLLTVAHKNTPRSLSNKMVLRYKPSRQLTSTVDLKFVPNPLTTSGEMHITYPGRDLKLSANVNEAKPREYEATVTAQIQRGKQVKMVGNLRNKSNRQQLLLEGDLEVILPTTRPISLSGSVKNFQGQSLITGNTNFGRGTYGFRGEHSSPSTFSHRLSGSITVPGQMYTGEGALLANREKLSGKIDLNMPTQHHIVGSFDVADALRQVDFDLMWDADRDQSRRVTVKTQYQLQGQAFHGSATVKCPVKTIHGTIDTDYQGRISNGNFRVNARSELDWGQGNVIAMDLTGMTALQSSRSLVDGSMKIRTPFPGFKTLDLKLKHDSKMPVWNSEMSAEWENNRKFSVATNGKYTSDRYNSYMEGKISMVTPFRTLERFSLEHTCERSPSSYSTNNEMTWNRDRKIGLGFYGSGVGNLRAGLNFTSPFETLRQLSGAVTHENSRQNTKTRVDALWNNRNQISMDIDGKSSLKGSKRMCSIDAKINTPFRGYEKMSSQMIYNNDGSEVSVESEINVNYKKLSAGFKGSNRNTRDGRNIEGKIYYTTPFANYENAEMRLTYASDYQKLSTNIEAKMPYNKWANLKMQVEYPTVGNLKAEGLMTSSFPGFERISSDMTYRTEGPRIQLNGQATYERKQIKFDGSGLLTRNKRAWNLDGNLLVNTPFRGYEDNKLVVKHNWQENTMSSQIEVFVARKTLAASHSLRYDDIYNFNNNIKVTSPLSLTFVVSHKMRDARQFRHESEVEWERNKRATAVLEIGNESSRNSKNLNAKLDVKTPFYNLNSLTVDAVYESNHDSVKPRINVQWNGFQKVNVEGELFNPRPTQIDAKLTITSTFRNFETVSVDGKMDLSKKQKTMSLLVQKREIFKVLVDAGNQNGEAELSIYSPLSDCSNVILKGNYELTAEQNSGNLILGCDEKSLITLNGQLTKNDEGHGLTLKMKTPHREMKTLGMDGRYSVSANHLSGQIDLLWANKNIALRTENEVTRNGLKMKTTAETPFRGLESLLFEMTGETQGTKKTLATSLSYAPDKNIQLNVVFDCNHKNRGTIDILFRSPFENLEDLSLNINHEMNPRDFKTEALVKWQPQKMIRATVTGRSEPLEAIVALETPFHDLRRMKMTANLENKGNYYAVNANCEWNKKKIELIGSIQTNGNQLFEGKMKLNTPFRGYHTMSLDSMMRNERNRLDGKISMVTPFSSMSKIEANGQYNLEDDNRALTLNLATPNSNYVVSGNVKMYSTRKMEGNINIETPIRGLEKFSVIANFDGDNWGSLKGDAAISGDRFSHKILANFRSMDGIIEGDGRIESSSLNNRPASLNLRANLKDPQNLEGSLEIEANSRRHSLQLSNKKNRRGFESEIKVQSPLIPRNEMSLKTTYKNSKNIQGSIVADVNSEKHILEFSTNTNDRLISGKLRIQCSLLPIKSLNMEGKIGLPSDNNFEAMLQVITPKDSHSATFFAKNEPRNLESQLTVSSPMLESGTATAIGKLQFDAESMDGFLTFNTPRSESRMAVNSRMTQNDFDGSFTLNTPFESLKMVRIDAKFNNRRNQLDGSLDVQSSIESMKKMSINGKVNYGGDAIDTSINVRLPIRNYNNIDYLGTIHKNRDWSSVTPRLTLSMANKKYTIFGKYVNSDNEFLASVGYETDTRKKGEVTVNTKNIRNSKTLQVSVLTPIRGYESYEMSSEYNVENNRHVAQITLRDPRNRNINIRASGLYHSILNFNVDVSASMPFVSIQQLSGRIQQAYRQNQLTLLLEFTKNNREKIVLNLKHNNDQKSGTITLDTPFENMSSVKLVYTISGGNNEDKVEVEFAGQKMLLLHQTQGQEGNQNNRNVHVEVIPLKIRMHVNKKTLPLGSEILMKSTIGERSMAFNTLYQSSPSHFSHSSKLTMDETSGQSIAYEIRKTQKARNNWDIFGRLDLPIRSFEVRGQRSLTGGRSMRSYDLYWDAARDTSKHVMVTGLIEDIRNRDAEGQKMQLTISHPKLAKDIVASTEYSLSGTEVTGKLELEYSRHQQHNLLVEGRAQNLARSRRDVHLAASLLARHPATNTDMQISGEVSNNKQESGLQVKVNYMDMRRQQRLAELKTKILKLKQEIEIVTKYNENSFNLMGRMFNRDQELTLALEEQANHEAPIHSHLRFSSHRKNLDVNITTADRETFHIRASMPDNVLHCEVSHTSNLRERNDVLFDVGLKENNKVFTKLNWRPEMLSEAKYAIMKKYSEMSNGIARSMDESSEVLRSEVDGRSALAKRILKQELNTIYTDVEKELVSFKRDYQSANYQLKKMYRNNDFYIRDVAEVFNTATDFISRVATSAAKVPMRMFRLAEDVLVVYWKTVGDMAYSISNFVGKMSRFVRENTKRMSEIVSESVDAIMTYTMDKMGYVLIRLADGAGEIGMYAIEKMDRALGYYAPSLRQMLHTIIKRYGKALEWINENYSNLKDNIDVSGLLDSYSYIKEEFLPNASDKMTKMYNDMNSHPRVMYIRDLVGGVYEQSKFLIGNFGLDNLASGFMREAINQIQELAWGTLQKLTNQVTDVRSGMKYVYEPRKGAISVEMRLPENHESLAEIFDVEKYTKMASKLKEKYFSNNDFSIWDVYYKYKNYASPSYWVPPFEAQAMIVGSQHYQTFDQFHFDFAGECSYLLARDFINGTFTVTINYVRDGQNVVKKSLNVYTGGVKIEIGSDYKVTVNDVKVELPQVIDTTVITREEGMINVLDGDRYEIKCNLVHDVCMMRMSGFYFGKTGGLFGVYNYEPSLDMMTPENIVAPDLEDYTNSWKVGTARCQKHNLARRMTDDYEANRMCKELFENNDSIFRSCFKQVKPQSYLKMCIIDVGAVRGTLRNEKLCTSAAAYVAQCNFNNVVMQMPKHCVRCEKHDGSFVEGGHTVKITSGQTVEAADIVFVVEEQRCNREVVRMMGKLAQGIEGNLKSKSYRNVRFAVVGFGGNMPEPHMITADSEIFGTVRSVDSALNSITMGDGPSDIFVALRYAARLPFRMGATKSIILAKCSACEIDTMKADYSEMLRTMLDGDITLHLLTDHDFVTKFSSKISKAKRVLGLDRKYAYTIKDVKDSGLTGDADLLAQVRIPKDLCVPLALEVGGSFFSTQRMMDSKRGLNKKAMEVLAKRVAKTAEPSECQVCECIATEYGIGKSSCQRCVSPVVAHMLSDEMSPMYREDYDEPSEEVYVEKSYGHLKPKVKRLRKKPTY